MGTPVTLHTRVMVSPSEAVISPEDKSANILAGTETQIEND